MRESQRTPLNCAFRSRLVAPPVLRRKRRKGSAQTLSPSLRRSTAGGFDFPPDCSQQYLGTALAATEAHVPAVASGLLSGALLAGGVVAARGGAGRAALALAEEGPVEGASEGFRVAGAQAHARTELLRAQPVAARAAVQAARLRAGGRQQGLGGPAGEVCAGVRRGFIDQV
eukprot:4241167-Pyramimonas_sp.AAC.1